MAIVELIFACFGCVSLVACVVIAVCGEQLVKYLEAKAHELEEYKNEGTD